MPSLLTTTRIDEQPSALVKRTGQVLHTFDHLTQDSGNVSWIVRTADAPGGEPRGLQRRAVSGGGGGGRHVP